MMKTNSSPRIIFNLQAFLPTDNSSENAFYRCKNNENYLSYISREIANKEETNSEQMRNEILPARSFIGYMDKRGGSTGLFNKDKFLNEKDIKTYIKKLQDTGSIVWPSVISFTPEFSAKVCNNKEQAQDLITENLPYLFENSHLDYDNIEWVGAYHTNTNNRHIHLYFFEKEPKLINSKGQPSYNKRYSLPRENIVNFKYKISKQFNEVNASYYKLRDKTRYGVSDALKNNKQLLGLMYDRALPIIADGKFQYARLSKSNQAIVRQILSDVITLSPDVNKTYNSYKDSLMKEQEGIISNFKDNHMSVPKNASNFYNSRMKEFDLRLYNEVLKVIRTTHFEKSPYLDFKATVKLKNAPSNMFLRNKNILDITLKKSNNIINSFKKTIRDYVNTATDEEYIIRKKLEGEVVNE